MVRRGYLIENSISFQMIIIRNNESVIKISHRLPELQPTNNIYFQKMEKKNVGWKDIILLLINIYGLYTNRKKMLSERKPPNIYFHFLLKFDGFLI